MTEPSFMQDVEKVDKMITELIRKNPNSFVQIFNVYLKKPTRHYIPQFEIRISKSGDIIHEL